MKTKLLTICLFLFFSLTFSPPSHAEWKLIGHHLGVSDIYIDFERVRKKNGYYFVWVLYDHKFSKKDFSSIITLEKLDCKSRRTKRLDGTLFSGRMGTGRVIYSEDSSENKWEYSIPNSTGDRVLIEIC